MNGRGQRLDWLEMAEPQLPIDVLVGHINNVYHSFDASSYDGMHPEIHLALPGIWNEMLAQLSTTRSWRILDYGCGTGFEAKIALELLNGRVEKIVCYDPAPEMLDGCRKRLKPNSAILFSSNLADIPLHGNYDLLITNSVLHHLPSVDSVLAFLRPVLSSDAMWLAGHEPSARFYRNPQCLRLLAQYRRQRRWRRFLDPNSYAQKWREASGRDPLGNTARVAFTKGWFGKMPSKLVISRLVDFHVAHDVEEAQGGRGFDLEIMQNSFQNTWQLNWVKTYSFLGPFKEVSAPANWQRKCRTLAEQYPLDGASFSCVWKRVSK